MQIFLFNILLFKKCDFMTKNLSQHAFYSWYVFLIITCSLFMFENNVNNRMQATKFVYLFVLFCLLVVEAYSSKLHCRMTMTMKKLKQVYMNLFLNNRLCCSFVVMLVYMASYMTVGYGHANHAFRVTVRSQVTVSYQMLKVLACQQLYKRPSSSLLLLIFLECLCK